jgi:hypothetical protein
VLREVPHADGGVQVEARHEAGCEVGAEAEEGLQGGGEEAPVGEVAGEKEDLLRGREVLAWS